MLHIDDLVTVTEFSTAMLDAPENDFSDNYVAIVDRAANLLGEKLTEMRAQSEAKKSKKFWKK